MFLKARYSVPAIVLGAGVNGLGVVRSLARAGVPVHLADPDMHSSGARTRYAYKLRVPAVSGDALLAALDDWARSRFAGQRPVLVLTQEQTVRTISNARAHVSEHYRLSLPPTGVLDALVTKQGFYRLALDAQACVPRTLYMRQVQDLDALGSLQFPVVVKPASHSPAYSQRFKKAYRVQDAESVAVLYRKIQPVEPNMVVQEWIDGSDSDIYFCLQHVASDGSLRASFVGRKIRSWPPGVGGTASCTSAHEVADELTAATSAFFRAVGVVGTASMEFKRDARSGRFMMIEPTIGRTDYQEEVATLHGVNIPLAAYRDAIGVVSDLPDVAVGQRVWRNRAIDRWSAQMQGLGLSEGMPEGARAVDAYWRWQDPVPGWAEWSGRMANRIRRLRRAPESTGMGEKG
ncbi:putative ATP-grasp enzyme [Salinisphaera dokdonensis CL-ES53]|uniref:ATP-grasp enzyme n=1 Tax=Salinisphaera dokdonensis CL-ES53 TaxID=1304272 RepID=A0ABV2B526_9GAMM